MTFYLKNFFRLNEIPGLAALCSLLRDRAIFFCFLSSRFFFELSLGSLGFWLWIAFSGTFPVGETDWLIAKFGPDSFFGKSDDCPEILKFFRIFFCDCFFLFVRLTANAWVAQLLRKFWRIERFDRWVARQFARRLFEFSLLFYWINLITWFSAVSRIVVP